MSKKSMCFNALFIITFSTILTFGLTDAFQDAEALKSQGTYLPKYGSATKDIVCGDRLCSEISNQVKSSDGIGLVSPQDIRSITEKAFIYAYPMLENYKTMYGAAVDETSELYIAPFNQLHHNEKLSTPDDTWVTTPNSDTLYSRAWLDLRAEPIIITIPKIEPDRYYTFQLIDFYSNNFGYVGTRTNGNDGGIFLIAGPNWSGESPDGITAIHNAETDFISILARTQVKNQDDVSNALEIMKKYDLKTLSEYMKKPQPESTPKIDFMPWDSEKAYGIDFVNYLNLILTWSEIHPSERQMFEEFSKIGIQSGKEIEFDESKKMLFKESVSSSMQKIQDGIYVLGEFQNGWMVLDAFGDREFHGTNYLKRSVAAMYGLYGNTLEEALYPAALQDADKNPLDGNNSNYQIKFSEEPPVGAFWSVTMYHQETRLLVENQIDRWLINSTSEIVKNEDGSFVIYVQHEPPSEDNLSNWLPAPDGPIYMILRLYVPDDTIIDGTWELPIIEKVEYECFPHFWKNNLDLWKKVGIDYDDDFDETFGRDYFEPDITLKQAIGLEGLGINHLARSGTAAYLNALVDPEIDEEIVRSAVNFGYVHQIDNYVENCKNIKKFIALK